jgi:hypothetical protein
VRSIVIRKIFRVAGIILVVLMLVAFIILLKSGIFTKSKYMEPWSKTYSDKFEDDREKIISNGILAASGHNMQPWKIKLDNSKNVFYLYVDTKLLTLEVDPYARQTMISEGTFLEYLVVSGKKLGYDVNINLFPSGEYEEKNLIKEMDEKPVAKVTLSKVGTKNSPLYDYMFLPDTNREPYEKTKLTQDQIDKLTGINDDNNSEIKIFQDSENLDKLKDIAIKSAEIEANIHRMNEESAKVFRTNEYEKNKYRYGFSLEGQGMSGIKMQFLQGLITLIPSLNSEKQSTDMYIKSTKTSVDSTPAYAMIITKNNSRLEQVKSGMLYSRLILTAESLGLATQPLSQAIEEYTEMKEQFEKIHKEYATQGETIQMIFRIGKPTKDYPKTMRKDVEDFIKK